MVSVTVSRSEPQLIFGSPGYARGTVIAAPLGSSAGETIGQSDVHVTGSAKCWHGTLKRAGKTSQLPPIRSSTAVTSANWRTVSRTLAMKRSPPPATARSVTSRSPGSKSICARPFGSAVTPPSSSSEPAGRTGIRPDAPSWGVGPTRSCWSAACTRAETRPSSATTRVTLAMLLPSPHGKKTETWSGPGDAAGTSGQRAAGCALALALGEGWGLGSPTSWPIPIPATTASTMTAAVAAAIDGQRTPGGVASSASSRISGGSGSSAIGPTAPRSSSSNLLIGPPRAVPRQAAASRETRWFAR